MSPVRILFIAEGQLGDLLLLTPALRAAKESFPQSRISVLVVERRSSDLSKSNQFGDLTATPAERESSVLSTNRNVDELFVINRQALRAERGRARISAELSIIKFLRRKNFDAVICTFPEDRFAVWAFASGARVRIGQRKQGLHRLLNITPDIEKRERGVLEYYCDLVRRLGATVQSRTTEYSVPDSSKQWADKFLGTNGISSQAQLVLLHPGATGNYKIWPPDRYAILIDYLTTHGATVLLSGAALDEPVVHAIEQHVHGLCVGVETSRSVGNLAALMQRCRLCITNDSGPRHLAIAVGIPSLAFFRHHHETEWGVYEETSTCRTLAGRGHCPVCPAGVCLDTIPDGEQFASYCLRMLDADGAAACAGKMLAR